MTRTSRRAIMAACAVLLVAAGCGSHASAPPSVAGAGVATVSPATVATLLTDYWVRDRTKGGFFIPWTARGDPAFSLYDTRWQLELAHEGGYGADGVSAAAAGSWLDAAMTGEMSASDLPAIVQVEYAVEITELAGGHVDTQRVGRALSRLRAGGLYRASATAAPDPGSTAIAVRLLTMLGLPVPAAVVRQEARSLSGTLSATIGELVSYVQIAAALRASLPATAKSLAVQVGRALDAAPPGVAWLAEQAAFRPAAAELGLSLASLSSECSALVAPGGTVRLPGESTWDPQATADAVQLRCRGARVPGPAPHTVAGWPTAQAVAAGLSASTAAFEVARLSGLNRRYRSQLRRYLLEVWLPRVRGEDGKQGLAYLADQADLRMLARGLGGDTVARVGAALPVPALSTDGGDGETLLSLAVLASADPGQSRLKSVRAQLMATAARPAGQPTMLRAAWLALAGRLLGSRALLAHARQTADRFRVSADLYTAATVHGTPSASFSASAIGVWIGPRSSNVPSAWSAAGLCVGPRCAALPDALPGGEAASFDELAVILALRRGDYTDFFPVAF